MANVKIELIPGGVVALLKSAEMLALIEAKCAAIASAASAGGGTFGHDVVLGKNRVHGMVWTEDFAARHAEAKDRVLTKAIDAGRA